MIFTYTYINGKYNQENISKSAIMFLEFRAKVFFFHVPFLKKNFSLFSFP
ncbi:hypothetical protein RND71_029959 [Anisodus tanguticus]|uniref:Uncharacterized protein n=1 Tax=Anisodus tanguticus TaxID=243964 RepID=A0AAE1RGI1_9SOLA|nr:hypothetical protein RND71_029959 [Anisodus tanguticus]